MDIAIQIFLMLLFGGKVKLWGKLSGYFKTNLNIMLSSDVDKPTTFNDNVQFSPELTGMF